MLISADYNGRAEATQLLAYNRPGGTCPQNIFHEVLKELPGIMSKLLFQKVAPIFQELLTFVSQAETVLL